MKKIFAVIGQFVLFLVIFAVGSFLHPFNIHWASSSTRITESTDANGVTTLVGTHSAHYFVPDGLLLAVGVLLAIVVVQLIRKRTRNTVWTVLAFALAVAAGYAMRFGYVTQDLF
jgi:xanthine/uracil permease